MTWTDERKEQVRTLWNAGHSASYIAGQVGAVSRNAVTGIVHRSGWHRGPPNGLRPVKAEATQTQIKRRAPVARVVLTRAHRAEARPPVGDFEARTDALPDDGTPPPGAVPFGKLQPWHCRYPFGASDFLYCAAPASIGSYCSHHHEACHQPMPVRGRKPGMGPQVKVNF